MPNSFRCSSWASSKRQKTQKNNESNSNGRKSEENYPLEKWGWQRHFFVAVVVIVFVQDWQQRRCAESTPASVWLNRPWLMSTEHVEFIMFGAQILNLTTETRRRSPNSQPFTHGLLIKTLSEANINNIKLLRAKGCQKWLWGSDWIEHVDSFSSLHAAPFLIWEWTRARGRGVENVNWTQMSLFYHPAPNQSTQLVLSQKSYKSYLLNFSFFSSSVRVATADWETSNCVNASQAPHLSSSELWILPHSWWRLQSKHCQALNLGPSKPGF